MTTGKLPAQPVSAADDATLIPAVDGGLIKRLSIPNIVRRRTHIILAASNSYNKAYADHVCDGTADQDDFANALEDLPATGGLLEMTTGTYSWSNNFLIDKNYTRLRGPGGVVHPVAGGCVIVPTATFPNDTYCITVYGDETQPMDGVDLRGFGIHGMGQTFANTVNGIDYCAYRSRLTDVDVYRLSGDGLKLRATEGHGNNDCFLSSLQIYGNGRYGMRVDAPDQHWHTIYCGSNGIANLYGDAAIAGSMIYGCHFFSGDENSLGTQTVNSVLLPHGLSKARFANCKFEHAAREVMWLDATLAGGSVDFTGCHWRGGSSEADNTYSSLRITRDSGSHFFQISIGGASTFYADLSTPKYLLEFDASLQNSRIDLCRMTGYGTAAHTPLTATNGLLSTIGGLGYTGANNPNAGGSWQNAGQFGAEILGADGSIWRCTVPPSTWKQIA